MSKKETIAAPIAAAAATDFDTYVNELAARVQTQATLTEGGIVTLPKDHYESELEPTGLTMAQVRKLQDHDSRYRAGVLLGVGNMAAPAFQANENLSSVSLDVRAGHDRFDLDISRTGEVNGRWLTKGSGSAGSHYGKVSAHLSDLIKRTLS